MGVDSPKLAFAIVTDSAADITPEEAARRSITVIPLTVTIDGEPIPDGTLTQPQFFERMSAAASLPTTSQPSIGTLVEAYKHALETAERVISIHVSSQLSGTIEAARSAAEQFAGLVHVHDSRNLSMGQGWQVIEAAEAASEGLGVDAAIARLERIRERVTMIVGLDSLDNLARGGRIGKVGAFLGGILNFKVTLSVDPTGAFVPVGRSRGDKAAFAHTLSWVAEKMGDATSGRFAIGHAMSRERAEAYAAAIRERYHVTELVIYEAGSAMATHTGTGWSVALVPEQ